MATIHCTPDEGAAHESDRSDAEEEIQVAIGRRPVAADGPRVAATEGGEDVPEGGFGAGRK